MRGSIIQESVGKIKTARHYVNCYENHPANYRGYIVAKTLQKRRNNSLRQKQKENISNQNNKSRIIAQKSTQLNQKEIESRVDIEKTYAEAVKEKEGFDEILKQILIKLEKQEQTKNAILD